MSVLKGHENVLYLRDTIEVATPTPVAGNNKMSLSWGINTFVQ